LVHSNRGKNFLHDVNNCQYKHEEMVQCVSTVTPQLRLLVNLKGWMILLFLVFQSVTENVTVDDWRTGFRPVFVVF